MSSRTRFPCDPPPPLPLALVSASFSPIKGGGSLSLTFDRAVDVSGFSPASVTVDHIGLNLHYVATGIAFHLNALVIIAMASAGPTTHLSTVLNADAANGIIAVDDGGAWPGVVDLGLPFP